MHWQTHISGKGLNQNTIHQYPDSRLSRNMKWMIMCPLKQSGSQQYSMTFQLIKTGKVKIETSERTTGLEIASSQSALLRFLYSGDVEIAELRRTLLGHNGNCFNINVREVTIGFLVQTLKHQLRAQLLTKTKLTHWQQGIMGQLILELLTWSLWLTLKTWYSNV